MNKFISIIAIVCITISINHAQLVVAAQKQAYIDSIDRVKDSIAEYRRCYKALLPLSKKIKEKEHDLRMYIAEYIEHYSCESMVERYEERIKEINDSIASYKDSIKNFNECKNITLKIGNKLGYTEKYFNKLLKEGTVLIEEMPCTVIKEMWENEWENQRSREDSIVDYKKWYKNLHVHDFSKTLQKKIGGITIKKIHKRYGSDEWVIFYIFNDVEGDGDAFEVMHDNKCDEEDEWTDDCYLNDDYIDPEVPIFYKGEHIATVNIDYYSQKKLSWSSICHIDDSRINDIKACVRKFK